MTVFEYVIVHTPTEKGKKPYIVDGDVFMCLAENRDQVLLDAGEWVASYDIPLNEVELIVRPFVG